MKEEHPRTIETTQYHTIAITVRSNSANAEKKNTEIIDKVVKELPTLYTTVDIRLEPHHYEDTHEETW